MRTAVLPEPIRRSYPYWFYLPAAIVFGVPFVHCPTFSWELTGAELLEQGRMSKNLPGIEMLLAFERMSDAPAPRDVSGRINVDPKNGPHGHRAVYLLARQIDDAKIWTSALYVTFK